MLGAANAPASRMHVWPVNRRSKRYSAQSTLHQGFLISRSRVLTNAEIYLASVIVVAPLAEIV